MIACTPAKGVTISNAIGMNAPISREYLEITKPPNETIISIMQIMVSSLDVLCLLINAKANQYPMYNRVVIRFIHFDGVILSMKKVKFIIVARI